MAPANLVTVHLLIDPSKQNGSRDITPKNISEPLFGGSGRPTLGRFWPFPSLTLTKDLRRMKNQDLFFYKLKNLPNFITRHPSTNHLRRTFSQLANLVTRLNGLNLDENNDWEQTLVDILSLVQEGLHQGFSNGKPTSDLSSIIEHDHLILFRILLAKE